MTPNQKKRNNEEVSIQDLVRSSRVRMKGTKKPKSISWWKKKAWKVFSKYIKTKYSKNGYCQCITCGKQHPLEETHAGHYIHGNTKPTYFDERNVHPQCVACNMHRSGNLNQYALYLEGRYGVGILQELDAKSNGKVFTSVCICRRSRIFRIG